MTGEKVNQNPGSALGEVGVNTILTMVVRVKQPLTVKLSNGREYDIVWNPQYTEPEIIVPGTTAIDNRGIAQVLRWLEKQTDVIDFYPQTKHHAQPNDTKRDKTSNLVLSLTKDLQKLNATDAHAVLLNIKHTKDLTAVVSVYDGVKPAHMVLEELSDWAEKNNPEVQSLIESLTADMSWNAENPV